MIKINQVTTRRVEVCWETGDDFAFLKTLNQLVELRNKDKEQIIGLKEEYI